MRSGVCPKCGSEEVYVGPPSSLLAKRYNIIPITIWFYAVLDYYVCANCGYVESYIIDEGKLRKISQKWPRVSEQKKKREE
jgi:hypothetical protein